MVTFTYIQKVQRHLTEFVHHLESYLPLFRQLSEFRFLYLSRIDSHFGKATEIFSSLVKIPLESDIASDLLRYFRVRKAWDEKQYGAVTDADLIFRNHAQCAVYRGNDSKGCIADGKTVASAKSASGRRLERSDRKRSVGFDTFLLQRIGPVADSANTE